MRNTIADSLPVFTMTRAPSVVIPIMSVSKSRSKLAKCSLTNLMQCSAVREPYIRTRSRLKWVYFWDVHSLKVSENFCDYFLTCENSIMMSPLKVFANKHFKSEDVQNELRLKPSLQSIIETIFSIKFSFMKYPLIVLFLSFLGISSSTICLFIYQDNFF